MKRLLAIFLALLMVTALLTIGAAALGLTDLALGDFYMDDYVCTYGTTLRYVEATQTTAAHYTVFCSGLTPNTPCALLVVKGDRDDQTAGKVAIKYSTASEAQSSLSGATYSVSEESIMYIDQMTSSAGTITFDFIPKSTPDCLVFLTGGGLDAPTRIGILKSQGVEVTGHVTYQDSPVGAKVTILSNGSEVVSTTTDTSGNYTLDSVPVSDGYTVLIEKASYCDYTLTGVNISEACVLPTADIRQIAGDVIEDNTVNVYDLTDLLKMFNKTGAAITTARADVDGNSAVNVYDLQYLLNSFNNSAITRAAS